MTNTTPTFLSAPSANALISELRPTNLSQPALEHINALIDEILHLLISSAESINPSHIRTQGIPAVFNPDRSVGDTTGPRALGRSAVAEAELELRSWYETHPGAKRGAFGGDGKGTGVTGARAFPIQEATDLLKLKCVSFSTLAPTTPPSESYELQVTNAWKAVGGDVSENTLSPSGLWITAILEHVCEHVLRQLSRVVARDSSIAVAGVQDLYVALCEDESIWGLFKRLQVKESLEAAIKAGTRRKNPIPHSQSQNLLRSSTNSKTSLPNSTSLRDTSIDQSRQSSSTPVEHIVQQERSRGPVAAVARAVSSSTHKSHNRSLSTLSNNTKTLVTAFQDQYDSDSQRRPSAEEDEFDALVRSGETMKVSLTPSRLKNFDMSPNRRAPPSPTQGKYVRAVRPTQTPDLLESGSMPSMPSALGADAIKKQKHGRSSSGQRLVARNAATIKEHENEEDEELLDGPKGKKESLADIFASEPREKDRKSSGSGKRVVPAVVLGSPPPQETSTLAINDDPIGRKTKRNDLSVTTAPQHESIRSKSSGNATSKPRGRSEAQELADFFSSTEPPPDTLAPPSPNPDEPPKSAKSFKSFMSRMTGKKASKDNERQPMPSAFSQAPSASVKRQKSFGSFKSNPASPPVGSSAVVASPPMTTSTSSISPQTTLQPDQRGSSFAPQSSTSPPQRVASYTTQPNSISPKDRGIPTFTNSSQAPALSDNRALHAAGDHVRSGGKLGADEFMAAGVAALTMGAGEQTKAVAPEKRMGALGGEEPPNDEHPGHEGTEKTIVGGPSRGNHLDAVNANAGSTPESKPPRPPRYIGTSQRSIRPIAKDQIPILAPPISTAADEYVVVNKSDAMITPPAIDTTSTRDVDNSPGRQTPSTAAQSQFASDAVSFRTASEGATPPQQEEEPVASHDHEDNLAAQESKQVNNNLATREGKQVDDNLATQESKQVNNRPESKQVNTVPSIPISDLVPLRGLLQHATSARECQLLLGAILSQLGIPHSSSSHDETIDPESRVTAWLLAGREGPVDYPNIQSPRSMTMTMPTTTETSPSQTLATPSLSKLDLDVGKVVANGQGETDCDLGMRQGRDTVNDDVDVDKVDDGGREGEGWSEAVRIPGDDESNRIRDEVIGA